MAGKKISRANLARIQQIADHAHAMGAKGPAPDATPIKAEMSLGDQIQAVAQAVYHAPDADGYCFIEDVFEDAVIIELSVQNGCSYWKAAYSQASDGAITLAARDSWVQVEEVWQPVSTSAKAEGIAADLHTNVYASIKALADRHLEVKIAYGGHKRGKDSHDEYFDGVTDFDPENYPTPPLFYYHGYDEHGKKMGKPITTGRFVSRESRSDGHYLTYKLKDNRYADLQWDAAQKGMCAVSPGTVGHLIRRAADGHLDYWPLAEVSAWDYAPNRKQANLHSIAVPMLKAAYLDEGISLPSPLSSEVAGDATSTSGESSPLTDDEQRRLAAQIVADQLRTYRKEITRAS